MDTDRLLDRFYRYVRCDSESGYEAVFCEMIENELRSLGLDVTRDEVGERCGSDGYNIFARLKGDGDALLLSAHLDTVCPGKGVEPIFDGEYIRSAGNTVLGADDKAGVAAIMEALTLALEEEAPRRTIEILFTVCEEPGLHGSKCADFSLVTAKKAVVLDSETLGEIVHRAPANMFARVQVRGKAAHAGMAPEQGIHALKAASRAVAEIPIGRVDEITVMNIANFSAPGKTNIIADYACFDMEFRSLREERLQEHIKNMEHTLTRVCKEFGADFSVEYDRRSDVVFVPEDSPFMNELHRVYKAVGVDCKAEVSFGGSDATYIHAAGIEVLNLGIGMCAVHSCDEHIAVRDLITTAQIQYLLIRGIYKQ